MIKWKGGSSSNQVRAVVACSTANGGGSHRHFGNRANRLEEQCARGKSELASGLLVAAAEWEVAFLERGTWSRLGRRER